jgi:hypothetical protein
MSAVQDGAGNLWLETFDEGVIKYDGLTITRYSVNGGEKNSTLFSI